MDAAGPVGRMVATVDIEQSFQEDLRLPPNQIKNARMVVCNGAHGVVEAKMMLGLLLEAEPSRSPPRSRSVVGSLR